MIQGDLIKYSKKISRRGEVVWKIKMIDMDIMNTTYQDIFTSYVLNTMLHHVGMLWIIEKHEKLQYKMDKHNP